MFYGFFTNRWILMGIGFLIIFAGLCYLFYQYTTAPYRKDAALHHENIRQYKKQRTVTIGDPAEDTPIVSDDTAAPSTNETAAETIETDAVSGDALDPSKMSRFGLGPYPEIPKEWGLKVNFLWDSCDTIEEELLTRVTMKMRKEGIRSKYGSVGINPSTGLIIALERGSVLVEYEIDENGEKRIYRTLGHPDDLSQRMYTRFSEIPSHLKVVTPDDIAFDPYEYLRISK